MNSPSHGSFGFSGQTSSSLLTRLSPAYLWPGRSLSPIGRATSKFAAVARGGTPHDYGIRLQTYDVDPRLKRQFIALDIRDALYSGDVVHVSSTVSGGFEKEALLDQNADTAWSSQISGAESSDEWFALWFGTRRINSVQLTPRRVTGKAYCFPATIAIYYSAGPDDWQFIREVSLDDPGTNLGSVLVHLDQTIETDGLLIVAKQLRVDDFGNYYFQMAGAQGCYRTYLDETAAVAGATLLPDRVFFFGDEPNVYKISAKEYARGYDRFVSSIRSGSPIARVSPAGLENTNLEYAKEFLAAKKPESPVSEWRFHQFYDDSPASMDDWKAHVKAGMDWAAAQGIPMVLGSFGSPSVDEHHDMRGQLRTAMEWLKQQDSIVEAVYWTFNRPDYPGVDNYQHPLFDWSNNTWTREGTLFKELMWQ